MTAYSTEVLADSPVLWIRGDDNQSNPQSTGYADSSGNARHVDVLMSGDSRGDIPLGAIPLIIPGPKKLAMQFPSAWTSKPYSLRTTYTQGQPTVGTYEGWVRFAANPGAKIMLWAWSAQSGGSGTTFAVSLDTAGKIVADIYTGSVVTTTATTALSTNTWHHVIVSIGAAGLKIRTDKTANGSNAATSVINATTASFWIHGSYNGSNYVNQTGAVDIAESAFYSTQLTDARTDAHYDATSDPVTITGAWG